MREDIAKKAASLLERIENLEVTIFKLEQIKNGISFKLSGVVMNKSKTSSKTGEIKIEFPEGKLSSEIFKQNIISYTIDNFNVELEELKQELEDL